MSYTKHILVTLLVFGMSLVSFSQSVEIETKLDSVNTVIGMPLRLNLKATSSMILEKDQKINFPQIKDTLGTGVEVLSKSKINKLVDDGKEIYTQEVLVAAYDSGVYVIPPMEFEFINNGEKRKIISNKLRFGVQTVAVDSTQVADIKMPYDAPLTIGEIVNEYWYILVILLAVGLIVFGIVYYLGKRKQGQGLFEKYVPKEPAHIIAIRALDELKEQKLWQQGQVKEFYSELTDVVRRYLEDRFGILAMEETTPEILKDIKMFEEITTEFYRKLQLMFELADLAKFAKYTPAIDDNETSMEDAYLIIRGTKFVEQILEESPEELKTEKVEEE